MVKAEQYKNLKEYFKDNFDLQLEFFLSTEGCYVISTEGGILLGYRCDRKLPYQVDLNSKDLYIQYMSGDISEMIDLASNNIENILFDHKGNCREYPRDKIKEIIKRIM